MSTVDELRSQLLQLSPQDRAELARDLLLSLEDTESEGDVAEAWIAEVESRADSYARGELTAQPWRDSVDRLRAALAQRRAS